MRQADEKAHRTLYSEYYTGKACPLCGYPTLDINGYDECSNVEGICPWSSDPDVMRAFIEEKEADFKKWGNGNYGHYYPGHGERRKI